MTVVSTITRFTLEALITPAASGCFNRLCQQLFNSSFTQPLAPACQARWVDWWFRLQVSLAGEYLPIRVLDPLRDDLFVGQVEGVLQVEQSRNQAR
jgi:hypothetical protein